MIKLNELQKEGVKFLVSSKRCILADDTGFGKTAQVLTAVDKLECGRVLYVTGVQSSYQVVDEVYTFSPNLTCVIANGTKVRRRRVYDNPSNIIVISYNSFRNDVNEILKQKWDCLILDDASKFKNHHSLLSQAAKAVSNECEYAWALTATPIETELLNIWAIFDCLNFHPLGNLETFYRTYCLMGIKRIGNRSITTVVEYKNLQQATALLSPFLIKRINTEDVPTKVYIDHRIELGEEQKNIYNVMRNDSSIPILARFQRSLQACDTTYHFDTLNPISSKLSFVIEFLQAVDGKVVIYSLWKKTLAHLKVLLAVEGISFTEISGDIKVGTRVENQKRFNTSSDVNVMLVTQAAEQGLNLQSARYMLCINRLANPARMHQVHGRIARIGSSYDKVYIINLISVGTVEEKMLLLSAKRKRLSEKVLGGVNSLKVSPQDAFTLLYDEEERNNLLKEFNF